MSHDPTNPTADCGCRTDCEFGLRNNYYDRKPITPLSFQVEQDYGINRRRLLNRAIHGWGVVYGYEVKLKEDPGSYLNLWIGDGLALDVHGRELLHVGGPLREDQLLPLEAADDLRKPPADWRDATWLLSVHYAEEKQIQTTTRDSCGRCGTTWDQTCETVRFSIRRCKPEPQPGSPIDESASDEAICKYLTNLTIAGDPDRLREYGEPDRPVLVDAKNGVPLAYLTLKQSDGGSVSLWPCAPRRLVKRNDLLFDLIPGRNLTSISKIGWERWHVSEAEIPFAKFSAALTAAKGEGDPTAQRFEVEFSSPVHPPARSEDCFAMTILFPDDEGGWWRSLRVPITRVEWYGGDCPPEGPYPCARLIFDKGWAEDAARGPYTKFRKHPSRVEIEIRGDLILDCNGRAVDANAIGRNPLTIGRNPPPTGNGTPGGTFLSTFRVGRDESQTQA